MPDFSTRGWRYDPIPRNGQAGIDFEPTEFFDARETVARTHHYSDEDRFWRGVNFGRDLMLKRATIEYREILSVSLAYLIVKSINDLLAAVSIAKSGYPVQSWPSVHEPHYFSCAGRQATQLARSNARMGFSQPVGALEAL